MNVIFLSATDLAMAGALIFILALLSLSLRLDLEKRLIISALRTTLQLLAIGFVLRFLFASSSLLLVGLMATVMLLAAGREVMVRQKRRLRGWTGYALGTGAMFVSSFTVTLVALCLIIQPDPWYTPQYAIPLLGMLLGNTMNGVALGSDRLTSQLYDQRAMVEQRLLLGQQWHEASLDIRKDCIRTGMIPIINAMAAAGLVSLPGMMTGQILGGSSPLDAVKYQILIMFLIAAGTGFGVMAAVWFLCRHLFDDRQRLRLDKLM